VLNKFSVEIQPGKSVALVGPSGSGKSTIVSLLEKWYEPEDGTITIDGVNLRNIDPQFLHRYTGIVQQEPTLFATTIKRNILYSVECANEIIRAKAKKERKSEAEIEKLLIQITDEGIIEAAKAANAHDFITKLPLGYDTILGERGVSLSGGQKQRVAIARALLQNPSILLLDEATSALDTKSEALVQDALEKLMVGRTSIVIAHRLSTVQNCDSILVLKRGEIVEMGTHDTLIQNENGVYFGLAKKQMNFGKGSSSRNSQEIHNRSSSVDTSSDNSQEPLTAESKSITTPASDEPLIESKVEEEPKKKLSLLERLKKKKQKKDDFTNEEEVADTRAPKVTTAFPIFAIMGADWIWILAAMIAASAAGVVPIMFQLVFGKLIDSITPMRTADGALIPFIPGYSFSTVIAQYALYLAIIAIGSGIALFLSTFFSNFARERLGIKLKRIYFSAIINQEMGFFDIKKSGKLLSSLAEDVLAVQDGYSTKLTLFTQHIVQFIAGIAIAQCNGLDLR
jgi:ABC-type multidrug transport system fused ATPase/permease subunit